MHMSKTLETGSKKLRLPVAFFLLAVSELLSAQTSGPDSFMRFEKFRVLENIYEPSGIVQLPDERLLVVEDEGARALSILTLNANGELKAVPIERETPPGGSGSLGKLNDLEGVALDRDGFVYAVTSYSRTEKKGKVRESREKLVRFRIEGNRITNSALLQDLKQHMTAQLPVLDTAAKIKKPKRTQGFNIEGLAFDKTGDQLWFGFRSPLKDNKAIILTLENPDRAFNGETPRFTEILLDLDGAGIRGLTYAPRLQGYLVLTRREDKKKMPFELWFWSGGMGDKTRKVDVAGVDNLRRAEGIAPIKWGDDEGIIIVSDEGSVRKGKYGRYILLGYDQIVIDQ